MPVPPARSTSLALAACAALLAATPVAAAETTVIASGIDNPRGLALAPDGTLYVAAAGRGGTAGCYDDPEGGRSCFGKTSGILAIKGGSTTEVLPRLLSVASGGAFAGGASDVSVGPDGRIETIITSGTRREVRGAPKFAQHQAGTLMTVAGGRRQVVARISPLEWTTNIDKAKDDRNSNPYGVLSLSGHTLVADAGANAIIDVRGGTPSVFSIIPPNGKAQAVPTSLALAPDGSVYVGELALGAGPGKARVWRLPAGGGAPTQVATGFTAITGLAFAPDGTMYVTELSRDLEEGKPGAVVRVAPDGTRTTVSEKGLMFPAGAAADETGVYVSAFSTLPGKPTKGSPFGPAVGQVVKITP